MSITIALAGNPNSGKTTLFNGLTGANQFVGNWPGVTVEKKEGRLKRNKEVVIVDLPGIYSLSPYTLEEVVARNYLLDESPDAIINIVDGTNLERNLYLTTQLLELGIPTVLAVNMMDVVKKNQDHLDPKALEEQLGCPVVEISALKEEKIFDAANAAIEAAKGPRHEPYHRFGGPLEHVLAHIEEAALHEMSDSAQRFYAIKIFERDEKIREKLQLDAAVLEHIEGDIRAAEAECDDDAESIITNERYQFIAKVMEKSYRRGRSEQLSPSDRIDRVVTHRVFALPIFALVMFLVYFISITSVGKVATDWANEGVFGDGWHLFGIGSKAYTEAKDAYAMPEAKIAAFEKAAEAAKLEPEEAKSVTAVARVYDEEGSLKQEAKVDYQGYLAAKTVEEPDPAAFGTWIPGIPPLAEKGLDRLHTAPWLKSLILEGIIGGVGAVLGFVPQMLILFFFLAFLEACGYMARIAFVMDRIFRKFGLSGKSFIPMLIGTGCSVPGIMASRTIENERDRRMTIITTSFMPCSAKIPIIALIAGALFGGAAWVAPSAYFIGVAAIIISGIILKKTKLFAGDPAPFVMELPAYRWPTLKNLLRSMWERASSFIKKAGTVILLSAIVLWFLMKFGVENGSFGMVEDLNQSILAVIGNGIAWLFVPLGWGTWQGAVATITGLIAKENVVGTFGVLFAGMSEVAENGWQIWANMRAAFTPLAAFSFLIFNLLCAPCFAAVGAIKREMNSGRWTLFAVAYQCMFAYIVAFIVYQFGLLFTGASFGLNSAAALVVFLIMGYLLFRRPRTQPSGDGPRAVR
ncbi:Ferrous iron transport protein B [Clostridiaceae bacterium JG1575]|nr:Ferrous iron transport protein B [Clostridiaceae bacterium JG1575]